MFRELPNSTSRNSYSSDWKPRFRPSLRAFISSLYNDAITSFSATDQSPNSHAIDYEWSQQDHCYNTFTRRKKAKFKLLHSSSIRKQQQHKLVNHNTQNGYAFNPMSSSQMLLKNLVPTSHLFNPLAQKPASEIPFVFKSLPNALLIQPAVTHYCTITDITSTLQQQGICQQLSSRLVPHTPGKLQHLALLSSVLTSPSTLMAI